MATAVCRSGTGRSAGGVVLEAVSALCASEKRVVLRRTDVAGRSGPAALALARAAGDCANCHSVAGAWLAGGALFSAVGVAFVAIGARGTVVAGVEPYGARLALVARPGIAAAA